MKYIFTLVIFLAALYLPANLIAQAHSSGSVMFRNNPQLTGISDEPPVYKLKGINFRFKSGGPVRSTPAVTANMIYFGSGDNYFYALNASSGKEIWKFKTGAAVYSSPSIFNNVVYFTSRDRYLYALHAITGKVLWKFEMGKDLGMENYWDNYISSPIINGTTLYVGSGDGNLYAINVNSGKQIWKYNSGARIRTTPAVFESHVVFGNNAGIMMDVNSNSGALQWKFSTDGASNTFESKHNDRTSIYCSASISNGIIVTGGRDGIIYAIDLKTGKEKWRYDHKGPWILSTAIKDGVVFVGCGSDLLLQALDLNTGVEKWRLKCASAIFSSITVAGDMIYFNDVNFSGNLYAVNIYTGLDKWVFPIGCRSFSTPVIANGKIYCGAEDGMLYALDGSVITDTSSVPFKKIVYWQGPNNKNDYRDFQNGVDQYLRDYFVGCGYTLVNAGQLQNVMSEQINKPSPCVIVFADNRFPQAISDSKTGKPLVLQFLEAHGKIAIFNLNPISYTRDSTGNVVAFDDSIPEIVFGLKYAQKKFIRGIYECHPTMKGSMQGLFSAFTTVSNATVIEPGNGIAALATDEFGSMTEWIKNYGGPDGTGLLQLNLPTNEVNYNIGEMRAVIEYGVGW